MGAWELRGMEAWKHGSMGAWGHGSREAGTRGIPQNPKTSKLHFAFSCKISLSDVSLVK